MSDEMICARCGWLRSLHSGDELRCPCTCEMQGAECPSDCRDCVDGYSFVALPTNSEGLVDA